MGYVYIFLVLSLQQITERCQVLAKLHSFIPLRKYGRKNPSRKEYYLCRGMISQAILVWKLARDPHNCLFRARWGRLCRDRLLAAAGPGGGREVAPRRRSSSSLCSLPGCRCSLPPNFSKQRYSAAASHISTAVHFDLCSREAAEPPSHSEEQLLRG